MHSTGATGHADNGEERYSHLDAMRNAPTQLTFLRALISSR